jgi:hypothetical protein
MMKSKNLFIAITVMFFLILVLATITNVYGIETKHLLFLVIGISGAYMASIIQKKDK